MPANYDAIKSLHSAATSTANAAKNAWMKSSGVTDEKEIEAALNTEIEAIENDPLRGIAFDAADPILHLAARAETAYRRACDVFFAGGGEN